LRFGVFELDLEAGELHKQGIRVKLQEQQFQILALLVKHPGKLITREELCHAIWADDTFVDFDSNLKKSINRLRAALCDSAKSPRFIETLYRRGYRFIAPVQVCDQRPDYSPLVGALPAKVHSTGSTEKPEEESRRAHPWFRTFHPSRYWMWPVLAVLLLSSMIVYELRQSSLAATGSSVPPVKLRRSVAVLGFKNLSAHDDERWISTALAEWLRTDLSAGGQLRVISADSLARMQIEHSLRDADNLNRQVLAQIGKNVAANFVVVGSYATLGEASARQVRLDLCLEDTSNGETLDAISAMGNEANLFDLVSRAGAQLRSKLGIEAVTSREAAEIAVALPANHEAARLYSEGLENLRVFNALTARDLLRQAVAAEPGFALAHAALASAWARLGYDELARSEARKAFQLSSNLPRADRLFVEARYHEMSGEWRKASDIYRALFEFFPDSLDYGLALSNAQFNDGRGQDALETVGQLRNLPPPLRDDPRIDLMEARSAESLGDFKRDLAATERAAKKASAIASLLLAEARADQAWALTNLARSKEASTAADEARKIFSVAGDRRGVAFAINLGGVILGNQGNAAAAKEKYEEALAIYRQIGNRLGVADELDDLGDTSFALGEPEGSRRYYTEAMVTYREVGHENGVCLVKGALASVLMGLGDNRGAIATAQDAVAICQRLGDRSKSATGLLTLAKALRMQGDTAEGKAAASEAAAIFEEIGDRQNATRAKLILAQLLVDEGSPREAEFIARTAADEFEKQRASRDAALADAVLSRAAMGAKDLNEARKAIQRASSELLNCNDREVELVVQISAARFRAASGEDSNNDQAARGLEEVAEKANHFGLVAYELEPRLALAEMEIKAGNLANARSHLEMLQKEAADHGFGLLAVQAAADLKSAPSLQR